MKKPYSIFLVGVLCITMLAQGLPAWSCSFTTDTIFSYTNHPDFPLSKFAGGVIGIPERHYARSYLTVAYRYWSGKPLTEQEQQAALSVWNHRISDNTDGCAMDTSAWLNARKLVPSTAKLDEINTSRMVNSNDSDSWNTYCNCQTGAFETAAATLKDRIAKYGATSPEVKTWLQGQDAVFSNCGNITYDKAPPLNIPASLATTADAAAQQDRAYQIAAAHFYAQQFPEARAEFAAIAKDNASPWKELAGYLVVRSLVREATLAKDLNKPLMAEAQQKIKELSANPNYAKFAQPLQELSDFIAARIAPEDHLKDLAARISNKIDYGTLSEYTKTIDLVIGDSGDSEVDLAYEKLPASVKSDDMTDWLMVYQGGNDAAIAHAVEKWNATKSTPWLMAAISGVKTTNPETPALLAAARSIPASSPAYWTAFYNVNKLDAASGKLDEVRSRLDALLASPPANLTLSARNALALQRLALARNLAELVKFGIQKPACLCTSGGIAEIPDDLSKIQNANYIPDTTPLFIEEAGWVMDNQLPLSMLRQLAVDMKIPNDLRGNVAWTSFVRAALLGNHVEGRTLATVLKAFNKRKVPLLDAYLNAKTPEERKFAADFLMMQFSSAQPNPSWGPLNDDSYGDSSGWWWGSTPIASYEYSGTYGVPMQKLDPLFVNAAQKTQVQSELKKLAAIGAAPNYFVKSAMAWAKAHPNDPRVPQALHFAVKSTRYGITDDATSALSKQAFALLHKNYKNSPWTKKTPYYF